MKRDSRQRALPGRRPAACLVLLMLGALTAPSLLAQGQATGARLSGTVLDQNRAAVPGAKVTLFSKETGITRNYMSTDTGQYVFTMVPAGKYELKVEKDGFTPFVRSNLELAVGQSVTWDPVLQVGAVSESVNVEAEVPLINAEDPNVGSLVTEKQKLELPLNVRNVFGLVFLDSSVNNGVQRQVLLSSSGGKEQVEDQNIAFFNFGGARFGTTAFLVDGVWNTAGDWGGTMYVPGVDEVQEFKVQTNTFTAQYGMSMGNVVNAITKSGTSQFHGDAFEFFRNDKLDANAFFSNRSGLERAPFHMNQFGATAGGPLYIPKLYPQRNKTFIFGSYQGRRVRNPTTNLSTVPTDRMREGDFSELLGATIGTDYQGNPVAAGQIYDPFSTRRVEGPIDPATGKPTTMFLRDPFPNNVIPQARWDPITSKLVQYYPAANQSGAANNFAKANSLMSDEDAYTVRLDHNFSDNTRYFARWSQKRQHQVFPANFSMDNPADSASNTPDNRWQLASNLTHLFGPTKILSITGGWVRWVEGREPFSKVLTPGEMGFSAGLAAVSSLPPLLSLDGFTGLGNTSQNSVPREDRTISADFTSVHRSHTITSGLSFVDVIVRKTQTPQAQFNFGRNWTAGPDAGQSLSLTGNGFASFLLGTVNNTTLQSVPAYSNRKGIWGLYVQDDWKITSRLTLNLGVRWDIQTAPTERHDEFAFFDFSSPNPLSEQVGFAVPGHYTFVGQGQRRGIYNTEYRDIAPRLGLAYRATDRFVIRAGFSPFYIPSMTLDQPQIPTPGYTQTTPFIASLDGVTPLNKLNTAYQNGLVPAVGRANGALTDVGMSVTAIESHRPTPYLTQWMFGLGYSLSPNDAVQVTYLGNHGVKLPMHYNANQLTNDVVMANRTSLWDMVPNPFYGHITSSACGLDQPTVQRGQLLRAFPEYCDVTVDQAPAGFSNYNAVKFEYNHQWRDGLRVMASFTISKYLDNAAGLQDWASNWNAAQVHDNHNFALDKSYDPNDVPKSFVLNWVYELPVGKGKAFGRDFKKPVEALLGGWQLTGILTLKDGFPLSVWQGNGNINAWGGFQRPNLVGNPVPANQTYDNWIDPAGFAQAEPFTFGNAPRTLGNLRSPGYANLDLGVDKAWLFAERYRFQFRAEAYNALNRANFFGTAVYPGSAYLYSGFGVITLAYPNRDIQLGLKLYW